MCYKISVLKNTKKIVLKNFTVTKLKKNVLKILVLKNQKKFSVKNTKHLY